VFVYVNTHKNILICFIYLEREVSCIFKACYIISVLFSTKYHLFCNFIFFCSNNMFLINHMPKLKYQPGYLKVNLLFTYTKSEMHILLLMSENTVNSGCK
jgi:hypothetical protein